MSLQLTANALNHLFVQNSWALTRLSPFAGKTVRINVAPFAFSWIISSGGTLRNAEPDSVPDVTCSLSPSLLPRIALMDNKAFDDISFQGDSALSEALLYVFRNLRWDVAEDLSKVTGDVAAERIVQTAQQLKDFNPLSILNPLRPASNTAMLVQQAQFDDFSQQLSELRRELDQLEQRIQRLG